MLSRPLPRRQRAVVYALVGTTAEVVFTALHEALHRSTRSAHLRGHTYLWMPPIYACLAVFYEPLHDRVRMQPAWQRAATYAAGILVFEYVSGRAIERVAGVIPWDYRGRSRFSVGGATRLDYAPFWAAAGMALEHVDDRLRRTLVSSTP